MSLTAETASVETLKVHGIDAEIVRRGSGRPVLLLHGFQPIDRGARVLDLLAKRAAVTAPSHPGFGATPRPADFETVYDVVNFHSALMDALPYDKMTVIGFSFGGWLAAELAVRSCRNIDRLVLVDPLGIKVGDRETADIVDVFNTHPDTVKRLSWHDPAKAPDFDAMTDEQLVAWHRGWESLSLYGWHPYMHNPRLAYWLPRISVPTLVLWGAQDGIVRPAYGEAFAGLIPGARFAAIEQAGHYPHIEQPDAFVDHVAAFLNG
jgi:pimeloyl-ACP methyl ester carboxylesterase